MSEAVKLGSTGEVTVLKPSMDDRPWFVITFTEDGAVEDLIVALGSEEANLVAQKGHGVAVYLSLTGSDYRVGHKQRPGGVEL